MWAEILADLPRQAALLILEGDTIADRLLLVAAVLLVALWVGAMAGSLGGDPNAPIEDEDCEAYGRRVMSTKYKTPRG